MNQWISVRLACTASSALRRKHFGIGRVHRVVFVFAAFFVFCLMSAPQAHATTITVCATGCDSTTIQTALNSATSGDTIVIQEAPLPANSINITVPAGLTITIEGENAPSCTDTDATTLTTVDADESGRVFTILTTANVTLECLAITNGKISGSGGAIYNSGTLTVQDCTFTNNNATGGTYPNYRGGGAIFNDVGATLIVSDSTFSTNQATNYGGAVWNKGEFDPDHSTFQGNFISGGTSTSYGGAVYNDTSSATMNATYSIFSGNYGYQGGAIYNNQAILTVQDCTLDDNENYVTRTGRYIPSFEGGAIYNQVSSTLNVTDSTFSDNHGRYGGAIYNSGNSLLSSDKQPIATVTNSTFAYNTGTGGGAIGDDNSAILFVTNSTFAGNAGFSGLGGGILVDNSGVANVKSSIFASLPSVAGTGEPGGNCSTDEGYGTINDVGYNISSDTSCGFTGTSSDGLNPQLDTALKDNGGPQLDGTTLTWTVALLPDSLAVDAIPQSDCTDQASPPNTIATDERGTLRPQNGKCDIGAYELIADASPPEINISVPTATTYTINESVSAAYTCTEAPETPADAIICGAEVTDPDGNVTSVGDNQLIVTSKIGTYTFTVSAQDDETPANTDEQNVTYTVSYGICALYNQNMSWKSGAVIPIKLQLCNASGENLSSPGISLLAIGVIPTGDLENAGNSNPDSYFRYDWKLGGKTGGYIFNLQTTGYASGTYALEFTAGNDPTPHYVYFGVN